MLLSLLPGLRDLRTPLAVGYLWLLTLWLVLRDDLPSATEATGVIDAAYDIAEFVGTTGTLAGISFVAYLIGVITSFRGVLHRRSALQVAEELLMRILKRFHVHPPKVTEWDRKFTMRYLVEVAHRNYDGSFDPSRYAEEALERIRAEESELVMQLRFHSQESLYDSYDRKASEAEFRSSIVLPLIALIIVIATIESYVLLCFLFVPLLLAIQGYRRAKEAQAEIVQAVLQGVLMSRAFDIFKEGAQRPYGSSPRPQT